MRRIGWPQRAPATRAASSRAGSSCRQAAATGFNAHREEGTEIGKDYDPERVVEGDTQERQRVQESQDEGNGDERCRGWRRSSPRGASAMPSLRRAPRGRRQCGATSAREPGEDKRRPSRPPDRRVCKCPERHRLAAGAPVRSSRRSWSRGSAASRRSRRGPSRTAPPWAVRACLRRAGPSLPRPSSALGRGGSAAAPASDRPRRNGCALRASSAPATRAIATNAISAEIPRPRRRAWRDRSSTAAAR